MSDERKTAEAAYNLAQKALNGLSSHEDVCAERYRRLDEMLTGVGKTVASHAEASQRQVDELKEGLRWAIRLAATILVGLVAYFGHAVISG
jgi:hypothetical protein